MEAQKPKGFGQFDNLMRKLVKVPMDSVPTVAEPKTFADLDAGGAFIVITPTRDGVPVSTVFIKVDGQTACAEAASPLGRVRFMPDVVIALWPGEPRGKLRK